jgi:hypothetical protein
MYVLLQGRNPGITNTKKHKRVLIELISRLQLRYAGVTKLC